MHLHFICFLTPFAMKRSLRVAVSLFLTFAVATPAFAITPMGAYMGRMRPARRMLEKEVVMRYVTKMPAHRLQMRQIARLRRPVLPRRLVETGGSFERPTRRAIQWWFEMQRM